MLCPYCLSSDRVIKRGFYTRPTDKKRLQRFNCKTCRRRFSEQYWTIDYRYRRRKINQGMFRALAKGNSQRTCALLFDVNRKTIARRVLRYGRICESNMEVYRNSRDKACEVYFDELETFEHTKLKPLTVPVAVEKATRKVLALSIGTIAAKGHLAALSRKKYGKRSCERSKVLDELMQKLTQVCPLNTVFTTDKSQHYPPKIKQFFPQATHKTTKGRRGCVVGQGELKRGGFDPLFSLNHTLAMFRDNLKTLSRRTWCTTKKAGHLRHLLMIYGWFHNLWIDGKRKRHRMYLRYLLPH